jgi:SAM-dependent methyltransferase
MDSKKVNGQSTVVLNTMNSTPSNGHPFDIDWNVEPYHWWFVVRRKLLRFLLSSITYPEGSLALDVGCGVGSNLAALTSLGLTVVGLDLSFQALSLAKKRHKCPFINGNLNQLPIHPNSVGLIIASDILEHLEDDSAGIASLRESLKDKGILILTVPAFRFLWGIQDRVTGHQRRYSRQEIINKLEQGGFEVLRSSYFNFLLFLPILLGRQALRLIRPNIPSENIINSPMINFLLKAIFSMEPVMLKHFSFPFGVSIFCIARKVQS